MASSSRLRVGNIQDDKSRHDLGKCWSTSSRRYITPHKLIFHSSVGRLERCNTLRVMESSLGSTRLAAYRDVKSS